MYHSLHQHGDFVVGVWRFICVLRSVCDASVLKDGAADLVTNCHGCYIYIMVVVTLLLLQALAGLKTEETK